MISLRNPTSLLRGRLLSGAGVPKQWGYNINTQSSDYVASLNDGVAFLKRKGYDLDSIWEQPVPWGESDSFRHLNNVHYARYAESARIRFMEQMAAQNGGPDRVKDMLNGRGIGLILKSLAIQYRRPVVYPDTLLISQKPHAIEPTQFTTRTIFYSMAQKKPVSYAESVIVWYDYETLKKTEAPANMQEWLKERDSSHTLADH